MNPNRLLFSAATTLVSLTLLNIPLTGLAQTEDFNDGDDAGWTRFSPLDIVGASSIFTFPDSDASGKAYRLQSPAPPVPDAGPARSFTYREASHGDFSAAVDIVDWNNDVNQAFGVLFRATEIGLGQTLGYVFNYDPQQASGARGQIQFNIVTGEAAAGTIGAANLSLEPGHQYRFVMRAEGTIFNADVYDLTDLTSPIVSFHATDDSYDAGAIGLFNFYRGSDVTDADLGIADTTFDNLSVQSLDRDVPFPGTSRGIASWPHVLNLVPLNRTNFHPADSGIQFTLSSLDETPVDSAGIRLWLNGSEVTQRLQITATGNNLAVSLASLDANTVYDARLEIPAPNGATAKTIWTFDTFSQAFLQSDEVKIIELEDYNFDGGRFINDPEISGFKENGAGVNANEGYVDREGEPGVDFFDYETAPAEEDKAIYRSFDPVATQAGASETGSAEEFSGPDPAVNDTIREHYRQAELPEIQITNTEGGEWLNYTREFSEGVYHVYLRGAGRATQAIHLDEVTGDPSAPEQATSRLGTFTLPNMGMEFNYRYVPLLDADGTPIRLELSGEKTLRLSIGSEQENRTNETTALNYLAFVPAPEPVVSTLQVMTSGQLGEAFATDASVVVEGNTITLPIATAHKFLTISSSDGSPVSVTSIQVIDGAIVIEVVR